MKLKAYRVVVDGWPGSAGIYASTTPAGAKYAAWLAFSDAGYNAKCIAFMTLLKVRRAPEHDELMAREKPGKCYSEEFIRDMEK